MLYYLFFGVCDFDIVGCFYDVVFVVFGYCWVFEDEIVIGYGVVDDEDVLCLKLCDDVVVLGFGFYLVFVVVFVVVVDVFYVVVMVNGGVDNGVFGLCFDYGDFYYVVFVVDFEGYCIEVVIKVWLV